MSSFQPPIQQRIPVGPGMRACGNCGQGTPLGSPEGMCQGCRDERDAIREEAWRRLAAAKQGAPAVAQIAASAGEDEPQEYVDDLPPAPMPAPRPRAAANPMTFPGQGPSPLRPVASGSHKARRRHTGPLRMGDHRFSQERVGYQGAAGRGARKSAPAAPKVNPVLAVRQSAKPKASAPWGAMLGGLILAVGLGAWGFSGGGQARAGAPKVAFTPAHVVAQAQAPVPTEAQVRAIAQAPRLPDRDEASRLGAAFLGSAPQVRYAAPVAVAPVVRYAAPVAVAPSVRYAAPVAVAPAVRYAVPRAYRHAAPAPRAYRYAAAPRHAAAPRAVVRGGHRSLAEAMVLTSRPGPAPGAPRRQGGVEVIGW